MLDKSSILECMPRSLEMCHVTPNIFVAGCLVCAIEANILIFRGVLGLPLFLDNIAEVQSE